MGIEVHTRLGRRKTLGDYCTHIVADVYFNDMDVLEAYSHDPQIMVDELTKAIQKHGATIISHNYHVFHGSTGSFSVSPGAFTIVFLLMESHVAIHTWPENKYAAIDVFTCGTSADPVKMVQEIVSLLEGIDTEMLILNRGPFLDI